MPTPLSQKPPMAAWIVRERKRLGLKPRDLVDRLAAQGLVVTEATVKVWEANGDRRPAPENIDGLERIFESQAPVGDEATSDIAELLRANTRAIDRQTDMLAAVLLTLAGREMPSDVREWVDRHLSASLSPHPTNDHQPEPARP